MVLSGGSSSARGHGVDRFYSPPAIRRQLQQQLLQQQQQQLLQQQQQQLLQQQQQQQSLQRPPKARPPPAAAPPAESDDSSSKSSVLSPSSSLSPRPKPALPAWNVERFLQSTTPFVAARYFPKTSLKGWRNCNAAELGPYFNLGDLWESFREWSAYGAGVPLVLNGSDSVIQYYVPFLSGIQLFVDPSRPSLNARRPGEESDGDICQDTSSDGSSESETERLVSSIKESLNNASHVGQEGFFSDDSETSNQLQRPVFEYLEHDPPYRRQPLADKISALASKFPALKTYRSCDLLPSSWISVAWYPIYRIPTGPTLQDLDACFLTFHSLSKPLNNNSGNGCSESYGPYDIRNVNSSTDISGKIPLRVFGLASYKFEGSIWSSNELYERQLASSLWQAADKWLHHVQVDHPDYRFFLSHYNSSGR